ncbi:unnamed protein product, partial [marine sediment metagenome]
FRLIGEEHLDPKICQRVYNIVRNMGTITWNGWALREPADYRAADFNPDINATFLVQLVDKDPLQLAREYAWRCLGKFPPPQDTSTLVVGHSLFDKTRAPDGMHKYITETFVIPADTISEQEWLQYKKDKVITEQAAWQSYAPNITWDNIIDCFVNSPYDTMRLANMRPSGEEHVIADVPSQIGSFRPIPELAQHRTVIVLAIMTAGVGIMDKTRQGQFCRTPPATKFVPSLKNTNLHSPIFSQIHGQY